MSRSGTPFLRLAAYASPAYITGSILFPTVAIIPAFYAKEFGLNLAVIGTILTVGRVFDAVTDPLIGHLSDITKSPIGRRKPWIVGGLLMSMVALYCLFVPGPSASVPYFATWFLLIFLAITMIDIPHKAWGAEISRHYDERSRIGIYQGVAVQLGSLTFAVIPMLPIFASRSYNAQTLKFIAVYFIFLMPFTALAATLFAPDGTPIATEKPSLASALRSVRGNKPFLVFLVIYIIGGLGNGVFYGLVYLYCDSYLKIGHLFAYILIVDALSTFVSLPVWLRIIYKFGKHKCWAVGNIMGSAVLLAMLLFKPGPSIFIPFMILISIRAVSVACAYAVPAAMLGDVIDYDILKTGVNRSGNYFSVATLIQKINSAIGGGIGFIIIGSLGYTVAGPNSGIAVAGFVGTTLILPSALLIIASVFLWFFPIDHRRQSIIRRRIERRALLAERNGRQLT